MDGGIFDDGYLPIEECAERLGMSVARVEELVQQRVLKAYGGDFGVMVQPALVSGVTTRKLSR